jgi:hypothetical protein
MNDAPSWDGYLGWRAMQAFDETVKAKSIDAPWEGDHPYPEHPAYFWGRLFLHELGLGDFERSRPAPTLRPQFHDLWFLYWATRQRRPRIILEYGVGFSTVVFAQACYHNGFGLVQSLDTDTQWVGAVWQGFPEHLKDRVAFMVSAVVERRWDGRKTLQHLRVPDIIPDLIYVDGPDLQKGPGPHFDGIVDPLYLEPKLRRGCGLVVDGRPRQCQLLHDYFQRPWRWEKRTRWQNSIAQLLS